MSKKVILILAALLSCAAATGCNKTPTTHPAEPVRTELKKGTNPYVFEPESIVEVSLTKNDPETTDHWTVRLKRRLHSDGSKEELKSASWNIVYAPEGRTLLDTMADGRFIHHLLDTLQSMQVSGGAPNGELSSFGLSTPAFALQWKSPDQSFELQLGNTVPKETGRYALIKIKGSPQSKIYIQGQSGDEGRDQEAIASINGAALQMLSYLTSFDVIRARAVLTSTADDVDEIEILRQGRSQFKAERAGDHWISPSKRKLPATGPWLEALFHARVRRFIDDPKVAAQLLRELKKNPTTQVVFKDRKGKPTKISILARNAELWCTVSDRPGALMELFPEAIRLFQPPAVSGR